MSRKKNRIPSNRAAAGEYPDSDWDDYTPSQEVFDEMRRVSKNQIIFGGNYFAHSLPISRCWAVWYKRPVGNISPCELAWTSFTVGGTKHFEYLWEGYWQEDMKNKEKRYHPTQKPTALMRWCLSKYAKEGNTILDPFMGSGTTLQACKDLGLNATGIEINPDYVKIAQDRLKQEVLL
jgi:site-specific DNA-methyltransferase (adenine-specific)